MFMCSLSWLRRWSRRGTRPAGRGGVPIRRAARRTTASAGSSAVGSSRQVRTRPTFSVRTRPHDWRMARCCTTAERLMASGSASWLTEAGPEPEALDQSGGGSGRPGHGTRRRPARILKHSLKYCPPGPPGQGRASLRAREPQHGGDAVVPAGRVAAVDRQGMAGDERGVVGEQEGGRRRRSLRAGPCGPACARARCRPAPPPCRARRWRRSSASSMKPGQMALTRMPRPA